ncbi:tudor domain-containing protein 1 isoform X2 [Dendroctonus ponderosae]|uniref:tudor domain-containing protein 1 isoform X2 n=1 Tax=Dendroctonus ponderosae TaxID=77166 RepID=UPI002034F404|nr:tudor domain-containing protein 1 isoform X2 [Dendroctonus ponderosae]
MDRKKSFVFASVTSPHGEDIHRATLREAFGQFGTIKKIYVPAEDSTLAKVYFEDPEVTHRACTNLNGLNNWNIEVSEDQNKLDRNIATGNYRNSHQFDLNNSFSSNRDTDNNSTNCDMDEDFVYAGQYVDMHGRPVEVLQSEKRQLFVSLDDVRAAGFNIFPKESFNNATIPKEMELKEFENYLLNQGMKYIINFKKTFDENEMVRVFEKVRARLQNPEPASHVGHGRQISKVGNSKNYSITSKTTVYSSPQANTSPNAKTNHSSYFENGSPQNPASNKQARDRLMKPSPQPSNRVFQDKPTFNSERNERGREANPMKRYSENNGDNKEYNGRYNNSKPPGRSPRSDGFVPKQNVPIQTSKQREKQCDDDGGKAIAASTPKTDRVSSNAPAANEDTIPLKIERLPLATGSIHKINISYVNPEKPHVFYGQKIETLSNIDDILLHVNTIDSTLPEVTPTKNTLCVALFEDIWYRAVVVNSNPTDTFVELIDYGNREHITTPVKEMSSEMKAIPAQANRFTVESCQLNNKSFIFETGQQFEISVTKQFDDFTFLIQIKVPLNTNTADEEQKVPTETPSSELPKSSDADKEQQEYFTKLPESTAKLLPDESVMIVNYIDTDLILRNKETGGICKKVYEHLSNMEKKPVSTPKVGQLVLCAKDTHEGLHRAIIKEVTKKIVEVEFVDYQGGDFTSIKFLRNFDATLASYPRAFLTLEYPVLSQISEEAEDFLNQLILQKKKIKTTKGSSNLNLMLPTDNMLLSEKLRQLSEPKPAPKVASKPVQPTPQCVSPTQDVGQLKSAEIQKPKQKNESTLPDPVTPTNVPLKQPDKTKTDPNYIVVSYTDMPFLNAPVGRASYCCYSCRDGMVTILSTSEKNEEYLAEILVVEEPDDTSSYVPDEFIMCLAKFQDAWYRAFVAENHGDQITVFFVDFGNTELIHKSEIRRFPKRLAEIPLLGITAAFSGIPDDPNVHKRLTELIPDESILEVDVTQSSDEEFKCKIEIPSIFSKLRQEGLI